MTIDGMRSGVWGSKHLIPSLTYGTYGWHGYAYETITDGLRHYPRLRQLGQYDRLFPNPDGNFHINLKIWSKHLDIVDDKAIELLLETSPDTTTFDWLLQEWEKLCGITDTTGAITTRRNAIIAILRARGGLSKPYFWKIAEGFGYNYGHGQNAPIPFIYFIEGGDFAAFRADISKAGDKIWEVIEERSVIIAGTNVENDNVLISLFNRLKPVGIKFVYRSE